MNRLTSNPAPPLALVFAVAILAGGAGCVQEMANQPRVEPLERSSFFEDQRGSRHLVVGTVARGHRRDAFATSTPQFKTGLADGEVADVLPPDIVELPEFDMLAFLERGRERYGVFCSHCHDLLGTGRGMVPLRGFPEPPTFHSDRLRRVPLGYFFRVITNGHGAMPAHAPLVPPRDRWAIAAYVRALQFSQHADVTALPRDAVEELTPASEETSL